MSKGVSYYTSADSNKVINIPFWEEGKENEELIQTNEPLFDMGEVCKECIKQRDKKRKKEHDCIFEKGSYHPMRVYTKEKLIRIFNDGKMGINCERAIFNYSIKKCMSLRIVTNWKCKEFKNCYKTKSLGVIFNLTNPKNPMLLQRVLNDEVKPFHIPFMTPRELFPEKWEGLKPGMFTVVLKQDQDVKDGMFQCNRCKSKKVHYYQLQTRSADEPMTTFCTCMECEKRWKFC